MGYLDKGGERDERPFHFQMWDSVSARVQREQARQKEMLRKEPRSAKPVIAAIAGMFIPVM